MPADLLQPESIEWALKHLAKYGDTDFLPPPFEINAMKAVWTGLKPVFENVDIAVHSPSSPLLVLAPKGDAAFRAVKQLSPFDSVLYAALAYEVAEAIEAMRKPIADQRVYSYRVAVTDQGQLFDPAITWRSFHKRSKDLVDDKTFNHVVVADIADFYNHIYLHRVRNALDTAGVDETRSNNVESFLMGLNAKNSRGLPIGPNASRLLAEAALHDVDAMLVRRGYTHVRYLDDFRIFVKSRGEAMEALHHLAYYLYTAHRLAFQSKKTYIVDRQRFLEQDLFDTEDMAGSIDTMDAKVRSNTLVDLFQRGVEKRQVVRIYDVGWIFRAAAKHRARALVGMTLKNLDKLVMVLPDVIAYLVRVTNEQNAKEIGDALYTFATASDRSALPFVQLWVLSAFCDRTEMCEAQRAMELADRTAPTYRDRLLALVARAYKLDDYVREQKEVVGNMGPWAQRATLWAGSCLTPDEARHWLEPYKASADPLVAAVAKAATP